MESSSWPIPAPDPTQHYLPTTPYIALQPATHTQYWASLGRTMEGAVHYAILRESCPRKRLAPQPSLSCQPDPNPRQCCWWCQWRCWLLLFPIPVNLGLCTAEWAQRHQSLQAVLWHHANLQLHSRCNRAPESAGRHHCGPDFCLVARRPKVGKGVHLGGWVLPKVGPPIQPHFLVRPTALGGSNCEWTGQPQVGPTLLQAGM